MMNEMRVLHNSSNWKKTNDGEKHLNKKTPALSHSYIFNANENSNLSSSRPRVYYKYLKIQKFEKCKILILFQIIHSVESDIIMMAIEKWHKRITQYLCV